MLLVHLVQQLANRAALDEAEGLPGGALVHAGRQGREDVGVVHGLADLARLGEVVLVPGLARELRVHDLEHHGALIAVGVVALSEAVTEEASDDLEATEAVRSLRQGW